MRCDIIQENLFINKDKGETGMNRVDELIVRVNDLLNKKEAAEKKNSKFVVVFAVIGVIVAVAAAAYGIYRFFAPDYLDDFEDDFDEDDFDDDFFDEEDDYE